MWVLTQCNPSNRALCVTKTVLNLSITVLSNTLNLSWGGGVTGNQNTLIHLYMVWLNQAQYNLNPFKPLDDNFLMKILPQPACQILVYSTKYLCASLFNDASSLQ